MRILTRLKSIDGSIKYVFETNLGHICEAIYYRISQKNGTPYDRYHICISSQSGCKMACSFCATGRHGFFSNLSHQEMLEQINLVRSDIIGDGVESAETKYSSVIMGMGEPLDNFYNLKNFCEQISFQDAKLETIPISSVGIVPKIPQLAEVQNKTQNIKLFISLHSPYDTQRSQMMPINKRYGIASLLSACKEYALITNKKVTLSYMLVDNVNDSKNHMQDFLKIIDPNYFKVQLLLYNEINDSDLARPQERKATIFQKFLEEHGIATIIRISKGQDIAGACGQLAAINRTKTK